MSPIYLFVCVSALIGISLQVRALKRFEKRTAQAFARCADNDSLLSLVDVLRGDIDFLFQRLDVIKASAEKHLNELNARLRKHMRDVDADRKVYAESFAIIESDACNDRKRIAGLAEELHAHIDHVLGQLADARANVRKLAEQAKEDRANTLSRFGFVTHDSIAREKRADGRIEDLLRTVRNDEQSGFKAIQEIRAELKRIEEIRLKRPCYDELKKFAERIDAQDEEIRRYQRDGINLVGNMTEDLAKVFGLLAKSYKPKGFERLAMVEANLASVNTLVNKS